MLFNSLDFAIYLPIVFLVYWLVFHRNLRYQNGFIAIASYVFYGWWDYRFLGLLLFSTLVDFFIGILLSRSKNINKRRTLLWTSIFINLGLLGFFKYYNFFVDSFVQSFSFFGHPIQSNTLDIILPLGISFYTFQTLSYTIDVYKEKLEPTKDFISFAAFVSFFPQLVAGPIERATNLLPQFYKSRHFDYRNSVDGLRQILWGLFKKMVIADNCAVYANLIFNNSQDYLGSTLAIGAIFFAFQIYCDFSGYSDIAIGTSRLFGFKLMQNFAFPYFSRDIAEFWRRWHISLSTWFRDYLYIPLGGSRGNKWNQVRNVFTIFIVSGFWHGANWTFVIWGLLNAIYFLPILLLNKNRTNVDTVAKYSILPNLKEFFQLLITFTLTVIAWIFFRSESLAHAWQYLSNMVGINLFSLPNYGIRKLIYPVIGLLLFFMTVEWLGRRDKYAIETILNPLFKPLRWFFYTLLIFFIGMYMITDETPFIYFQF